MLLWLLGKKGGHEHPVSDLIILPPASAGPDATALAAQISLPKRGRNEKGKMRHPFFTGIREVLRLMRDDEIISKAIRDAKRFLAEPVNFNDPLRARQRWQQLLTVLEDEELTAALKRLEAGYGRLRVVKRDADD